MINKAEVMREARKIEKEFKRTGQSIEIGGTRRGKALRMAWAYAKMELNFAYKTVKIDGVITTICLKHENRFWIAA